MRSARLPEGLADMPPGPGLAAALEAGSGGEHPVDALRAEYRQLAHQQARVLRAMVELTRARPRPVEWAATEIGAALSLTSMAADRELGFAETVVTRLPMVFEALRAGALDRAKAWVFADHLGDVPGEQAAVICAALVPDAAGWTTGQLRARLLRLLHEVDPDHARRRYRRAVRDRAVVGYLAGDGTVTVTASGLPADEAAVACERLDALAAAAQRAGHPGRLWQIQADLFLGMLDGSFHHLTERQIIAALLGRVRPEDVDPLDGGEDDHESRGPRDRAGSVGAPDTGPAEDAGAEDAGNADPADRADPAGPDPTRAEDVPPADVPPAGGSRPSGGGVPTTDGSSARTGVEIRVGLLTLLGLDQRCGEIPGLGPVLAPVARRLVAAQHRGAEWRFAVLDADGHLIMEGITRRRPRSADPPSRGCRRGVVELHIEADELASLVVRAADHAAWAALIADLAAQYVFHLDGAGAPVSNARPPGRFARGALARHIEIRDRACSFVGCRRPARKADKDHTRDHAIGGPTNRGNTGPLCERHHRLKTEGWWTLRQPAPGRFEWTSPLGRAYRTRGEPIRPPTVPPCPRRAPPALGPVMRVVGPIFRRPAVPRRVRRTVAPPDDPPF